METVQVRGEVAVEVPKGKGRAVETEGDRKAVIVIDESQGVEVEAAKDVDAHVVANEDGREGVDQENAVDLAVVTVVVVQDEGGDLEVAHVVVHRQDSLVIAVYVGLCYLININQKKFRHKK